MKFMRYRGSAAPSGRRSGGVFASTAALAAALLLSACSGSPSANSNSTNGTADASSVLTIAQADQVMSLDPLASNSGGRETRAVKRQIFDALVVQGDDLVPGPQLAKSWTNPDQLTWQFTIRDDATFTNGEKFTAETAKFNLDRIMDPNGTSSWRSQLESLVASVSVEGTDKLVIKTKSPSPTLLTVLAFQEMVPQAYLTKVGPEEFNAHPIGTGPFKFVSRTQDRVVLERNDAYWGGKPKTKTLIFRTIPDVAARIAALQSGEANIVDKVPSDLADTLSGDAKAVSANGTRVYFMAMNVQKKPFDDVNVRRAVGEAINSEELATSLYKGRALALNQPAFPEMFGYQKDLKGFSYDPTSAAPVLKALDTVVIVNAYQSDQTLAQAVVGQLNAAGMKAKLQVLEDEAFEKLKDTGTVQAYVGSWGVAEGDLDAILSRHFWSERGKDSRYTNYQNPTMDSLIVAGRTTTDQGARMATYAKVMDQLVADAPWRPLITPKDNYGVSASLKGWTPSPTGMYRLNEAALSK
jgi:peptide/nickel transport system substrate-binding protein